MKNKIAIVCTWPGTKINAEAEFVTRIKVAANNIGWDIICITRDGYVLDDELNITGQKVIENEIYFAITMHYEDRKLLDIYTYHAIWNPPGIILQYEKYPQFKLNIIGNDDFLTYDDGGMIDHLRLMLEDDRKDLKDNSYLTASFPATAAKTSLLDNPVLFYCGINWEKMVGIKPRHDGLFHMLDKLPNVKFFGPDVTWKGYKNYCGTIPFDGFSLLEEANKAGVVLAISSDNHYFAGAATNRVYEGCAAGAVIISDTNSFIQKNFGDSILYIDYNKNNPEKMYAQICKHLTWIDANKESAKCLAKKSQEIFKNKFALEKQLLDIIKNHKNRERWYFDKMYFNDKSKIAIFYFVLSDDDSKSLNRVYKQIRNQKGVEYEFVIFNGLRSGLRSVDGDFLNDERIKIIDIDFFDNNRNYKQTKLKAIIDYASKHSFDCFSIVDGSEKIFSNHYGTLLKRLYAKNSLVSQSIPFLNSRDGHRYPVDADVVRDPVYFNDKNKMKTFYSGRFLFQKELLNFVPCEYSRYVHDCIVELLICFAFYVGKSEIVCTDLITSGFDEFFDGSRKNDFWLTNDEQINLLRGRFPELVERQSDKQNSQLCLLYGELKMIRKMYIYKEAIKEKIGKIKCILGIGNVNKNRSRLVKIKNNIKLAKKELRFNGIDLLK